ncbi:MAG: LamG domain-containing protein, partial [Verrucomicrobia bacterium]|nr:LamG domain-containing protein [Verrucomicrobiota bacterium]
MALGVFAPGSPLAAASSLLPEALALDGAGGFVELGTNGPVLGTSFTEELWVLPPTTIELDYVGLIGGTATPKALHLGLNRAPSIYIADRTRLHGGFGDGVAWHTWTTQPVLNLGEWNHVAASYDGALYRVFVNGALI